MPANVEAVPKPITVGAEMEALRRFYRDSTWEGWIQEGGMGPETPKMKGIGRATFTPIQEGRWFAGDFEQGPVPRRWHVRPEVAAPLGLRVGSGARRVPSLDGRQLRQCRRVPRVHRGRPPRVRVDAGRARPPSVHLGRIWSGRHDLAERDGVGGRLLVPDRGVPDGAGMSSTDLGSDRSRCDEGRAQNGGHPGGDRQLLVQSHGIFTVLEYLSHFAPKVFDSDASSAGAKILDPM